MGEYTRIPADTFEQIQTDAGILLYKFDPANPGAVKDEDIICPTTGGITIRCVPTTSDMGEDVDNCPANLLELKKIDSWDCGLEFTRAPRRSPFVWPWVLPISTRTIPPTSFPAKC